MKLKSTIQKAKPLTTVALCSSLFMAQQAAAVVKPVRINFLSVFNEEEKPIKKSKARTTKTAAAKTFVKLNNDAVKIYPDALKREMHVVAKENEGKEIDFFVFDVEGTLLHNYKMQPKDHKRITGLKRGTYVYRVFSGDEETAAGKFEIR